MDELHDVLAENSSGDPVALDALYGELRKAARGLMTGERDGHTLDPTGLVNEAVLRLLNGTIGKPDDRAYLFAAAIRAMEQVLVDHARARGRRKRGGDWRRVPLDGILERFESQDVDVEKLHHSLERLSAIDPRQAEMVRMRYFVQVGDQAIADHFGLSPATVRNQLSMGRAWLRRDLIGDG